MTSNRPFTRALLAVASAALCATLFIACGDSDDAPGASATSALEQTFVATSKIDSGRMSARLALEPDGLIALGGPITLRASGPFAMRGAGEMPRFDVAIAAAIAGQAFDARALSTGEAGYLRLDGRDYRIDDDFFEMLRDVLGAGAAKGGGFASLGLDPSSWITSPETQGNATVGGVDTTRITGAIAVERLLTDLARLLDAGAGASSRSGGLLTPKLRKQIAAAVKSSKVEVWTGAKDRILRQLDVFVDFAFERGRSPITGLDGGRIDLRLRLDDVNATTLRVTAPKGARPLSRLMGEGGLGALLGGIGGALAGGAGKGDGGAAFLECLDSAGQRSADVARCAAKLAP